MKKPKDHEKPMNLEKESWNRELWEQLDGESDRAYGAFQTYLNLGMGQNLCCGRGKARKTAKLRGSSASVGQQVSVACSLPGL